MADKTTPNTPPVRIGQIWADNDKRSAGRRVEVVAVDEKHATVKAAGGKRLTRIRLDRFKPTSTGYTLVSGPDQ